MLILIVEDDKDICASLADLLSSNTHHNFIIKSTVKEAIDTLKKCSPHVILLDYILKDGCAGPLIQIAKHWSDRPSIILMTAANYSATLAARYNLKYILPKPFDIDKLFKLIDIIEEKNNKKIV